MRTKRKLALKMKPDKQKSKGIKHKSLKNKQKRKTKKTRKKKSKSQDENKLKSFKPSSSKLTSRSSTTTSTTKKRLVSKSKTYRVKVNARTVLKLPSGTKVLPWMKTCLKCDEFVDIDRSSKPLADINTRRDEKRLKLFEICKVDMRTSSENLRDRIADSAVGKSPAERTATWEVDTITDMQSSVLNPEEQPKVKGVHPKAIGSLGKFGYELLEELGSGGFSKVYKVKSKHPPYQDYACKMFDLTQIEENWNMKCLRQEMLIMFKIVHPNIIHGMDTFKTRTSAFIIMKFAKNGTVSSYLTKLNKALTELQAKTWWCDILGATNYLHEKKIAHRDIKCENFLLDENFNALLSDFSFSIEVDGKEGVKGYSREVHRRTICGTPCYMAPELHSLKESQVYDPFALDIFALGVALFEMLNNDVPYDGDYGCETMVNKMLARQYAFKESVTCSVALKQLIDRLLHPDAKKRPTSAETLGHDWVTNKDNQ